MILKSYLDAILQLNTPLTLKPNIRWFIKNFLFQHLDVKKIILRKLILVPFFIFFQN